MGEISTDEMMLELKAAEMREERERRDIEMELKKMELAERQARLARNVDTHGEDGEGWIGFDLDGTLAKYDGWHGIDHIGEPIKPIVELITKLHKQGRRVKIFTARIAPRKLEDGTFGESYITVPNGERGATKQYAFQYINDWCHLNLGFVPEIVYKKDPLMLELYDDRTKQVEPNTGIVIEDELAKYREMYGLLPHIAEVGKMEGSFK